MDAVHRAVGLDAPDEFGITGLAEGAVRAQSSNGSLETPEGVTVAAAVAVVSKFDGMM